MPDFDRDCSVGISLRFLLLNPVWYLFGQLALNEAKILSLLDHPNIVQYYDSFEEVRHTPHPTHPAHHTSCTSHILHSTHPCTPHTLHPTNPALHTPCLSPCSTPPLASVIPSISFTQCVVPPPADNS